MIQSPLSNQGATLEYFKTQVFSNAVFISDCLNGMPGVVHNTTAENVIRNRKHNDEIGREMMKRQHGMGLSDYISRRRKWIETKNLTILSIMNAPPLKASRKKKRGSIEASQTHPNGKKPKLGKHNAAPPILIELGRKAGPLKNNKAITAKVFSTAGIPLDSNLPDQGIQDPKEEDDHMLPYRSLLHGNQDTESQNPLPVSQLTPRQLLQTTEDWNSTRRNIPSRSKRKESGRENYLFLKMFRNNMHMHITGQVESWEECLLKKLSSHMRRRFSSSPGETTFSVKTLRKLLSESNGYCPKKETRDEVLTASMELAKSTVWDKGEIFVTPRRSEHPVADAVVRNVQAGDVVQNLPLTEPKNQMTDVCLCMEDLRRLVAPHLVDRNGSWLNDNIVGGIMTLYNVRRSDRRPIIFHCLLWLEALRRLNMKREIHLTDEQLRRLQREKRMNQGIKCENGYK